MYRITHTFILSAIVAVVAIAFSSCDEEDGLQDPMKWRTEVKFAKDARGQDYVSVPKEGGIYVFKCLNYDSFWVECIIQIENGTPIYYSAIYNDAPVTDITSPWASAKPFHVEDGVLTIIALPNTDGKERDFKVQVQAGNAGYEFSFHQKAN